MFLDVSIHGELKPLTVWPGDTLTIEPGGDITLISRRETEEEIVIRAEAIDWYSKRSGMAYLPEPVDLVALGYATPPEPSGEGL